MRNSIQAPRDRRTAAGRSSRAPSFYSCALALSAALALAPATLHGGPQASARLIGQGDLAAASRTLEAIADRVGPSVVQIFATGYAPPDDVDDTDGDRSLLALPQRSSGSGVILDPDGFIVTNAHVVEGAHRVQVQVPTTRRTGTRSVLNPRPRLVGAQVVAIDHETDLAVLKVAEHGLPALEFADSDAVRPGQLVLAFGSPLGLSSSVTLGVVSAVARQLEPEDPMIYIQTDAPINPGNSGGPLVDVDGRVVGINTLILSQSGGHEGIGFAAPSNIVRSVFDHVRRTGRVRRGEIGVRAQTLTPLVAQALGLAREWGVVLSDVFPGGPAAAAGLRAGDIIVALDGKPMENGRQLTVNLYSRALGETVRLEVLRGTQSLVAPVTIVERPNDPQRFAALARPEDHLLPALGVLGLDLTPDVRNLLPELREESGVVVAATLGERPPSWEGRFEPGDVIHAINQNEVTSLAMLRPALSRLKAGDPIVVRVERDGVMVFVAGRIE